MTAVRIAVAADASWPRQVLRQLLEGDGEFLITADETDPRRLLAKVLTAHPELIAIDAGLLGRGGLEAIEWVMAERPTPIVLLTATGRDKPTTLIERALKQGALAVEEIAKDTLPKDLPRFRASLRRLAQVPVVRHLHAAAETPAAPPPVAKSRPAGPRPAAKTAEPAGRSHSPVPLVGIGASIGGPAVLVDILSQLGEHFPAGIAVVQHLPHGFAAPFADYLHSRTDLAVEIVSEPQKPQAGTIYLPGDDRHLVALSAGRLGVSEQPALLGHRPAVDRLFHSLAEHYGRAATGVILSGLGRDGGAGLLAMRKRGAVTIAQDAATCVIDGMPGAARELEAAGYSLPPGEIAQTLRRIYREER